MKPPPPPPPPPPLPLSSAELKVHIFQTLFPSLFLPTHPQTSPSRSVAKMASAQESCLTCHNALPSFYYRHFYDINRIVKSCTLCRLDKMMKKFGHSYNLNEQRYGAFKAEKLGQLNQHCDELISTRKMTSADKNQSKYLSEPLYRLLLEQTTFSSILCGGSLVSYRTVLRTNLDLNISFPANRS